MIPIPPAIAVALLLSAALSAGQSLTTNAPAAATIVEPAGKSLSGSLSAYTYIVPDDREYVQPTLALDHDWLHFEARFNYENLDAGSLWFGYNLAGGERLAWEFTPMIAGVFGETRGVAPGYKGSLGWWKLELYSEGEYVIDTEDSAESFFYSWSELSFAPWDWLRVGLAGQRTRLYESDRDYTGGLLVGFTFDRFDLTTYVFNPDESDPVVVIGVTFGF